MANLTPVPEAHSPLAPRPRGRDALLDTVKAVAILRVIAWHTWSWWWLSWIPAMPAMFVASGALLADSLDRRGWWATVRVRVRRLLIPFWVYSVTSVVVMVAGGWRPTVRQLAAWVVPLADPVGAATLPGLWVPLWYLRAYLWFVLLAGALLWCVGRFGSAAIAVAAAGTPVLWWLERRGVTVPLTVADAVTYATFVLIGMRYRTNGPPPRRTALGWAVAGTTAALVWVARFGPDDRVVNRSYPLMLLVGAAGVGAVFAARGRLVDAGVGIDRLTRLIGRRALTIYLWQGLGLVAAQRLVDARLQPGPARAVLSLSVVLVVIAAAVVLVGPVEDLAAGRAAWRPVRSTPPAWRGVVAAGAGLVVVSLLVPLPRGAATEAPMSGRAVVARAGLVAEGIVDGGEDRQQSERPQYAGAGTGPAGGTTPESVLTDWAAAHPDLGERTGFSTIAIALVAPDGTTSYLEWYRGGTVNSTAVEPGDRSAAGGRAVPFAWRSMTKAATAAWFMRSVEAGRVSPADPLSRWLPDVPHAERITLEDLGRHAAGIPQSLDVAEQEEVPAAAIDRYRRDPRLLFEPGTGFEYSRVGYFLLALALERATGTPWREAMESFGTEAGVSLGFDEDMERLDAAGDPDGRGYHGRLWSSGGLRGDVVAGARFFRFLLTGALSADSVGRMADFSPEQRDWFYGLGLMPVCPCSRENGRLRAGRVALDAASGSFVTDLHSGATVMVHPDAWWEGGHPAREFYELQSALLDLVSG